MRFTQNQLKTYGLLALIFVAAYIVINQLFKATGMDVSGISKFQYQPGSGSFVKKRYYDWITPLAKAAGSKYGIPWQAIAVQTALETGWGKSELLQKHNNFGGIKYAGSGAPSKVNYPTIEYIGGVRTQVNSFFASWPNPADGLFGYANFFHRNQRYKNALKYPNDPYKFIEEIRKAGYATDPNYVAKLHNQLKTDFA